MVREIPLFILESLHPYTNKVDSRFKLTERGENLIKFIDKETTSDFYFCIEKYRMQNNVYEVSITFKPANSYQTASTSRWVQISKIDTYLDLWITLIEGYVKYENFFDEPLTQSYYKEYYENFILDDDAEINPFPTKTLLLLDSSLEEIQNGIDSYVTDSNSKDIEIIKSEIIDLRNSLTRETKKSTIKKISKIWAKITKLGIPLIKEFLNEGKKEVMKKIISSAIEYAPQIIEGISKIK